MNYKYKHIPISKGKRPGIKIMPEYLTIHSTANPKSTAENERNWLVNPSNTRTASWHIVVDEKEIIEAIPLNELAYHAGSKDGNYKSISIEICESGNRQKTLENAVGITAQILKERKWGIERLRRHFDWSGKNCPRILSNNNWEGWEKFKKDVDARLKEEASPWAKEAWNWAIKNGITDGKRPKDMATREEVITILYRMRGVK